MPLNEPRTMHLVDIENLVGSPNPSRAQVELWNRWYSDHITESGDQVVVASSHHAFATVGFAWPKARHLVRSGRDGADLALLQVLHCEHVADRFDRVVIASGDGIFVDAVAELGSVGIEVVVVARAESLAKRLRLAARHCLVLGEHPARRTEVAQ